MSLSSIPRVLKNAIFERDKGRCQYCQLAQFGQAATFHINHVLPRSKGGLTEESNLVVQCPYCSLHKSDKLLVEDHATDQIVHLLHPLQDKWIDHIVMDATGTCHGITSVGRITVLSLRMNDALPRIARAMQIRIGLLSPTVK